MFELLRAVYLKSQYCFSYPYNIVALFTNPFFLIRNNLYHHIKKYANKIDGKVLDFGCGSKPYRDLFNNCDVYVGCDIEKSGHPHENENIDYYYDGKKLPFKNGEFDCIFASEVFEHVFNLDEIIGELNRVLVNGGKIFCTVPFVWNEHEIPYDSARYTSYGIKNILEKNGFYIVKYYKSTLYVETIFQLGIEYLRILFNRINSNVYFTVTMTSLFIAPLTLSGILIGKFVPSNDSLYCNNIILCKKFKNL